MTRTRISLVSTILANELLQLVQASMPNVDDKPPAPVALERTGFGGRTEDWSVRYSALWGPADYGKGESGSRLYATGGIFIQVRLQAPSWGTYRAEYGEYRLPPDWSERRFKLAIARMELWAREQHQRIIAAERVYALQDHLTTDDIAAVERFEQETGRSSGYDTMTEADANQWVYFLKERHPEWTS